MNMDNKFSIIVPIYKSEDTIKRCIESVQNQSYKNWELILVNDGSPDQSFYICKEYENTDGRIRVFTQDNRGVSAARNYGLDQALGDYIVFLDSDDALTVECLEEYEKLFSKNNVDVVIGSLIQVDINGVRTYRGPQKIGIFGKEIWNSIAQELEVYGWAGGKAIRRRVIEKYHLRYVDNMYSQEDLEFNLRVYFYCNKYAVLEKAGYIYYYSVSTRKPAINDYLKNQLKLNDFCKKQTVIEYKAEQAIRNRIVNLVFMHLYECETKNEIKLEVEKLRNCEGLAEYISKYMEKGEKRFILIKFQKGQIGTIFYYFRMRNILRDIIRKIKK